MIADLDEDLNVKRSRSSESDAQLALRSVFGCFVL